MPKLGTHDTIDCPTKGCHEAHIWLVAAFEPIHGTVRMVWNPHDFGSYPSFEIDYPNWMEDLMDDDPEFERKVAEKDEWCEKAEEIKKDYSKLFGTE